MKCFGCSLLNIQTISAKSVVTDKGKQALLFAEHQGQYWETNSGLQKFKFGTGQGAKTNMRAVVNFSLLLFLVPVSFPHLILKLLTSFGNQQEQQKDGVRQVCVFAKALPFQIFFLYGDDY